MGNRGTEFIKIPAIGISVQIGKDLFNNNKKVIYKKFLQKIK